MSNSIGDGISYPILHAEEDTELLLGDNAMDYENEGSSMLIETS